MTKSPAFQFYPDKWQTDTRRLSWEAKGIYHELMCVVWLQFQETNSFPDDDVFISGEIGCDLEAWKRAKSELLNPHRPILKKTETNRLLIPGLLKEHVKQVDRRERLRQNGMLGGRPKNQKVIFEEPKNKAGSANLNERLPSPSPSPSPSLKEEEGASLPPSVLIKQIFEAWNNTTGLTHCLVLSDKRRRSLQTRLLSPFFKANWAEAMNRISKSPFCLGQNERQWKASFEWFISPDTVAKIMEGKYDPKEPQRQSSIDTGHVVSHKGGAL